MKLLRLEITKLRHQKRTWFGYLGLAAVPIIMTVALYLSDSWEMGGQELPILSVVFKNGVAVPIMALFGLTPFLLPLAASMVGAFTIAGEAESGTLRTILVRPVHRGSLLAAKGAVSLLYLLSALALVYVLALAAGAIAFGIRSFVSPFLSFGVPGLLGRTALAYLVCLVAMSSVVALAVLLSTLANSSLTAAIVSLVLVLVLQILLTFDFFDWLRPWLFTGYFIAWTDVLRDPVPWGELVQAIGCCLAWTAFLGGLAWLRFRRRDILI